MTIGSCLPACDKCAFFMRAPVVPVTRVVIGVNGSARSAAALRWAADEACRQNAALRIVSAWQETGRPYADDEARVAAARVQKALTWVLAAQTYPHRIGCATAQGQPGEVLLTEAGEAGLLVLGTAGDDTVEALGPTGRYCLRRGQGPLAFVPA